MIDNNAVKSMKQKGPNRWPRLVLRTADAYGISKNTDKYMDLTALNTVIYGNFL
jgi:hypothetical protein